MFSGFRRFQFQEPSLREDDVGFYGFQAVSPTFGSVAAGGEVGAGYLGEDREFHHGRVVSLAAVVRQVQVQA